MSLRYVLPIFVLSVAFLFSTNSNAQTPVPSGVLDEASSQLVFWYDNGCNTNAISPGCGQDRFAAIQVTNTNSSEGVWVHVQVYRSFDAAPDLAPANVVRCAELNFVDFLTPRDTHTYVMNDMLFNNQASPTSALQVPETKGFVLITPIREEFDNRPIAWQHLIGSTYISDNGNNFIGQPGGFRVNAMGRDAVNFANNAVLDDGTELDGTTTGFVVVQPAELFFNTTSTGDVTTTADVVLISFIDEYNDDATLGYRALPGSTNVSPFIHDDVETRISCTPTVNACFNNWGLIEPNNTGNTVPQANDNIDPDTAICTGNSVNNSPFNAAALVSWTRLLLSGFDPFENQFGVIATLDNLSSGGGADWMNAVSQ